MEQKKTGYETPRITFVRFPEADVIATSRDPLEMEEMPETD